MAGGNRVVVHTLSGEVLKGTTHDLNPARDQFHLTPAAGGALMKLECKALKAIFFVKEFEGNPERQDPRGFIAGPGETPQGKKVAVLFKDGELLCGYTLAYTPGRQGFFLMPSNVSGNNQRIYVVEASASKIMMGPDADKLVAESDELNVKRV